MTCIWCNKNEDKATFKKKAHTIPKSLGAKELCQNVCDNCNSYFGSYQAGLPPIETILKEMFIISRASLLKESDFGGKNRTMPRFKSTYFNLNLKDRSISLKNRYKFNKVVTQRSLGRLFRRGLYKVLLEEIERQLESGFESRYDFIREFARYGIGDYPVFYFPRNIPIIFFDEEQSVRAPRLKLGKDEKMKYLIEHQYFVEFELFSHNFSLVLSRDWEKGFRNYLKETIRAKGNFFRQIIKVEKFGDVDFTLEQMK